MEYEEQNRPEKGTESNQIALLNNQIGKLNCHKG
jgi:hypothetical protein